MVYHEKKREKETEEFYDNASIDYERNTSKRFCDDVLEHFLWKFLPDKKRMRILDAGGGIGRFSIPLAKKGHDITLTDISEGMLNEAKRISSKNKIKDINFQKESVTDMKNQEDEAFDVVLVMNAILDYCGNHKKALREIHRVLKPNGMLIGDVNNRFFSSVENELKEGDFNKFEKIMKTGDKYISWGDNSKGHVTHEFTSEELKGALEKANFKRVDILGVFNLLSRHEETSWFKNPNKRKKYLQLQAKYAKKKEYLNNSSDFLFVAKKPKD